MTTTQLARRQGLWIDDAADELASWQILFARRGLEIDLVSDAERALHHLVSTDDQYEFVLLDLEMPGVDGIEVLKRIKAIDPYLPVLVISGHLGEVAWDRRLAPYDALPKIPKPLPIAQAPEFHQIVADIHRLASSYASLSREQEDDGPSTGGLKCGDTDLDVVSDSRHIGRRELEENRREESQDLLRIGAAEPSEKWGYACFVGVVAMAFASAPGGVSPMGGFFAGFLITYLIVLGFDVAQQLRDGSWRTT